LTQGSILNGNHIQATCADLAEQMECFGAVEPHQAYVARPKAEYGKKTGFW